MTAPVPAWGTELGKLWELQVAGWLAEPHRGIRGLRISRPQGQRIYPGAVLQLSLPLLLGPDGEYGMTNVIGRVTRVVHEADSCVAVCDLLIQAIPPNYREFAPLAWVKDDVEHYEERYDPATRTFYLQQWPIGLPTYNNRRFVEPDWSSVGDHALFLVLQYDGVTWRTTCSGYVESVNTGTGTLVHTDDGLTGTFYSRMYAMIVLAPFDHDKQMQWPRDCLAILGPPAGLPESKKLLTP